MVLFFYGEDYYRLIQYVQELINRYQKKYPRSFNFYKFDLEEDDFEKIRNAIKGESFFKQVKFIIIKNPFSKQSYLEELIKENDIKNRKDFVLLVYQNGSDKILREKNLKLFNFLKEISQIKEFSPLSVQAMKKFALNFLSRQKISIKNDVLNKLIQEIGSDTWRLKNELEKLVSFSKKIGKKIIEEDSLKLINFKIDQNIFELIDSAFENKVRALILFENYFAGGGNPSYLLSMIAYQLRNLLAIKEFQEKRYLYSEILRKIKINPYLFRKFYETSKKFEISELKRIFQKLAEFEISLKSGWVEFEDLFFKVFL